MDARVTLFITVLVGLVALLFAVAPQLSRALVRVSARRLPNQLGVRLEEEWLGELEAVANRAGKLAFAIALLFTRRRSFVAPGEESMPEFHERAGSRLTVFGGWKALLIFPTLVFGLAAYAGSFLLPLQYTSEALIVVRPRDIPESYVPNILSGSTEQRLQVIEQQVLSRSNIARLMNEFKDRFVELRGYDSAVQMERIRNAIGIEVQIQVDPVNGSRSVPYFRIRYQNENPELAKDVAARIVQVFIDADAQTREDQINGTRNFLQYRLEKLAQRLVAQGELLARAKGREPEPGLALDYEVLQSTYRSLAARLEEARTVEDLEAKQRGAVFQILDAPNLPTLPSGPDRIAIAGLGAAAGLVFGATAILGLYRRQRRLLA